MLPFFYYPPCHNTLLIRCNGTLGNSSQNQTAQTCFPSKSGETGEILKQITMTININPRSINLKTTPNGYQVPLQTSSG